LLTAPILALDAVGPSTPTVLDKSCGDPNKSEQRHFVAQEICTFSQGRTADRDIEAQQFRTSGLNLVIAALAY
jgi:TnpA family transposase